MYLPYIFQERQHSSVLLKCHVFGHERRRRTVTKTDSLFRFARSERHETDGLFKTNYGMPVDKFRRMNHVNIVLRSLFLYQNIVFLCTSMYVIHSVASFFYTEFTGNLLVDLGSIFNKYLLLLNIAYIVSETRRNVSES